MRLPVAGNWGKTVVVEGDLSGCGCCDSEAIARQAEEQHGCWLVVDASWPDDLPRMGLGFDRVF